MTPLQHEPSAHAPWMRTIFGRAFISGSLRGRFQMTKQIRLCLPLRWGGIRSTTALGEKKNHRRSGKSISFIRTAVVAHSGEPASPAQECIRNVQSDDG